MNALEQLSCEKVQKGVNKTAATDTNWHHHTYMFLDVLVCSIAVYFYELCRIFTSS